MVCAASRGLPARTSAYGRPWTSACTVVYKYELDPTLSCVGRYVARSQRSTPILGSFACT